MAYIILKTKGRVGIVRKIGSRLDRNDRVIIKLAVLSWSKGCL